MNINIWLLWFLSPDGSGIHKRFRYIRIYLWNTGRLLQRKPISTHRAVCLVDISIGWSTTSLGLIY